MRLPAPAHPSGHLHPSRLSRPQTLAPLPFAPSDFTNPLVLSLPPWRTPGGAARFVTGTMQTPLGRLQQEQFEKAVTGMISETKAVLDAKKKGPAEPPAAAEVS